MTQASVAFASLFLGLLTGFIPVRVVTRGPVFEVRLELDGETAGAMRTPLWVREVDLGPELSPHELVARAFDKEGKEVARTRQWLNLPRPPAEVDVLVDPQVSGKTRSAQLVWQSLSGQDPKSVEVRLNGEPLAVAESGRIDLPAYDEASPQLLSVEIDFGNEVKSRKDVLLAGASGFEAQSELTAVAVHAKSGRVTASALAQCLVARGHGLKVAALEEGPAFLWVVRDSSTTQAANQLGRRGLLNYTTPGMNWLKWGQDYNLRMDDGDRMRIVWPRPVVVPGRDLRADLFPASHTYPAADRGLHWLLTSISNPTPANVGARFADAIAVAGLSAYDTFQRRAVLLLLGAQDVDESQFSPDAVRSYLSRLHVPLFVWSLGPLPKGAAEWHKSTDVTSTASMIAAFAEIRRELASQRIAWVEGHILPHELALARDGAAESGGAAGSCENAIDLFDRK